MFLLKPSEDTHQKSSLRSLAGDPHQELITHSSVSLEVLIGSLVYIHVVLSITDLAQNRWQRSLSQSDSNCSNQAY